MTELSLLNSVMSDHGLRGYCTPKQTNKQTNKQTKKHPVCTSCFLCSSQADRYWITFLPFVSLCSSSKAVLLYVELFPRVWGFIRVIHFLFKASRVVNIAGNSQKCGWIHLDPSAKLASNSTCNVACWTAYSISGPFSVKVSQLKIKKWQKINHNQYTV